MARMQILVYLWRPERGVWHCFTDRLNWSLVLSVAQAKCCVVRVIVLFSSNQGTV